MSVHLGKFMTEIREQGLQKYFLHTAGVTLSKDKAAVFKYDPSALSKLCHCAFAWLMLPGGVFTKSMWIQYFFLVGATHLWFHTIPKDWILNAVMTGFMTHLDKFTPFVLGLFVSLMIARTYYSNRGFFGTLFGRSLALVQMVVAWIRAPTPQHEAAARRVREVLIRWTNAAFRLMWLECKEGLGSNDLSAEDIGKDLLDRDLLTYSEWAHIESIPSRCTHIFQWINNVLYDCYHEGFIKSDVLLNQMHQQVEEMRAANVWGLPSLPLPYSLLIVTMVKLHLFFSALSNGALLLQHVHHSRDKASEMCFLGMHLGLFVSNFIYQGFLDLHGHLYNPNRGDKMGHMPSINFLDFVNKVSSDLLAKNASLPYQIDLSSDVAHSISKGTHVNSVVPGIRELDSARTSSDPDSIELAMKLPMLP